ncbi:hypothetical protein [Bacillus sp. ISL-7]|uniref:hypothetical protein n=1 Tax=Bacillus sp. ISL-7 TaxID=2819136 RepID=UPI001BE558A1|nr:hypothetical protein [Bacillus sp. ISL-7]MBT2736175.1 hypothetical protein [Bacillus sp. ISL-7]
MKAPIPKNEEDLIVDYIYTNYLIQILENDHQLTTNLNFKIPEAYQHLVESKLKILRTDLKKIRTKMKELKIKVAEPIRDDIFIEYAYFPHGYEGRMRFWEDAMAVEGTSRLKKLFNVKY